MAAAPGQGLARGGRVRKKEVKENRNAFPVIFCYTKASEDQGPEDSW